VTPPARPRGVAFLLPGQGSQHAQMAAGLYRHEPAFTEAMDAVFAALGTDGDRLRADWLADRPAVPLDEVTRSQPLLFAVDYALGRTVMSWGVRPDALLGHSVGELAAGALAGVFSVADAARVLWERVLLLAATPPGGMLAVAAAAAELTPFLTADVVIGAVNAPRQTLLAGPERPLAAAERALRASGLRYRRVGATAAFHSPAVALAAQAGAVLRAVTLRPPVLPVLSGYTAAWLSAAEATDPGFWAAQPAAPVRFGPALDALLAERDFLLVEAGPGQGLSSLARRHPAVLAGGSASIAMLPAGPGGEPADRAAAAAAAARLRAAAAAAV
jgi:[acyl-carrier-protein] S-malonyltransferase